MINEDDKDLIMFTITNLNLDNDKENSNMVVMTLKLKRKIITELLTTYLPTILLLIITLVTIFQHFARATIPFGLPVSTAAVLSASVATLTFLRIWQYGA